VFDAGHLDGTTKVTGYTGTDPAMQSIGNPNWNRNSATCSASWCHGGYSGVYVYPKSDGAGGVTQVAFWYYGNFVTPTWTNVDGTQAACGTCHGSPPATGGYWHSGTHGNGSNACSLCHPGVDGTGTGFLDPSRHVDGTVDVTPRWGSRCFNCH
jgi:predicted CxxxxCH...CXXCH cytochrome family protein